MTSFMGSEYGLQLKVYDENGSISINTDSDPQNPTNYISLHYSSTRSELEGGVQCITQEDADAALEAFLSEMEIDMDDFYIESESGTYLDKDGVEKTVGYDYDLGRMVGDVPCFIDHEHKLSTDFGGSSYTEPVFTVPWGYECFEIRIDSEGVSSVFWDSPMLVGENITQKALLKSFDEIANIYENMLMTEYEGFTKTVLEGEYDVHVTTKSAQLKLLRIRVAGEEFEGIYVPVWIFYGGVTIKNPAGDERYFGAGAKHFNGVISNVNESRVVFNGENEMQDFLRDENAYVFNHIGMPIADDPGIPGFYYYNAYDMPVMAINAVDGSIIDWLKGY